MKRGSGMNRGTGILTGIPRIPFLGTIKNNQEVQRALLLWTTRLSPVLLPAESFKNQEGSSRDSSAVKNLTSSLSCTVRGEQPWKRRDGNLPETRSAL